MMKEHHEALQRRTTEAEEKELCEVTRLARENETAGQRQQRLEAKNDKISNMISAKEAKKEANIKAHNERMRQEHAEANRRKSRQALLLAQVEHKAWFEAFHNVFCQHAWQSEQIKHWHASQAWPHQTPQQQHHPYNQLLLPAHQGQQTPFSENGCLFLHNRVHLCLFFFLMKETRVPLTNSRFLVVLRTAL